MAQKMYNDKAYYDSLVIEKAAALDDIIIYDIMDKNKNGAGNQPENINNSNSGLFEEIENNNNDNQPH